MAGVLPLLAASRYDALGQATSDDWSYLTSLAHLTQQGSINFNHWGTVFELGQLLLVSPLYAIFGVHPVLAVLWVWAVGMAGVLGLAYLGRRCGVRRSVTLLLITTLMLCPLFLQLDTTFMTDVPCFTFMVIALCLWIDCRDRSRFEWRRWAALGVATAAFTIREPAAFVAVPILLEPLVMAHRSGDTRRRLACALGPAAWVTGLGALWVWRQGISTSGWEPPIHLTPLAFLDPWINGWLPSMLGLFLLPILLTLSPWNLLPRVVRRHRGATLVVAFLAAVPLVGILTLLGTSPRSIQLGNYVSLDSALPLGWRLLLSVVGLISCAAIALILYAAARSRRTLFADGSRSVWGLSAVILTYSAFIVGARLVGIQLWDRYWLIALALGGVVLNLVGRRMHANLGTSPTRPSLRRGSIAAVLGLLAFLGAATYSDTAALLAGEWNFADQATTHLPPGYGPRDISVDWLWNATVYTSGTAVRPMLTHDDGIYRYPSGDASGSFMFIYHGLVETCAPFTVKTVGRSQLPPTDAAFVGPVVRGLFASYRFVLVHQTPKECGNVAQFLHVKD
jgi:hypothetical protein